MKELSKEEMKKMMGGVAAPNTAAPKCDFGHPSCETDDDCKQVNKGTCNNGGCCTL